MKNNYIMNKTFWQKVYSALGFWYYFEDDGKNHYKVWYWCCLPDPFPWYRKFDICKIKINLPSYWG